MPGANADPQPHCHLYTAPRIHQDNAGTAKPAAAEHILHALLTANNQPTRAVRLSIARARSPALMVRESVARAERAEVERACTETHHTSITPYSHPGQLSQQSAGLGAEHSSGRRT